MTTDKRRRLEKLRCHSAAIAKILTFCDLRFQEITIIEERLNGNHRAVDYITRKLRAKLENFCFYVAKSQWYIIDYPDIEKDLCTYFLVNQLS